MKKIITIVLLALLLSVGCKTNDCGKCPVVVKTRIIIPTIACYQPDPYEEFQKTLLSTSGIESEGKLFEIIAVNVKMMERHIILWQEYRNCVNKIIQAYKDELINGTTKEK